MPASPARTRTVRLLTLLIASVAALLLSAGTAAAAVLVDGADATPDAGGCGTAPNPCGTIDAGIANANPGDTVSVAAGTYAEDVVVDKAVTLQGAGAASTTIRGPRGGGSTATATVRLSASGAAVDGFTITRAGNTPAEWDAADLNLIGVAVQTIGGVTIRNNRIVGNRTGIDVNNSSNVTIQSNDVTDNRTGLIFRNQTDNLTVTNNAITGNWTVGLLFLDASGGTNTPIQQAIGSTFTRNAISGNWYGQVVDRQTGGALPAPGLNTKDFSGNWLGTATPVVSTAGSAEPGYASLIPVAYGGTATAPGGQPDVLGAASANIDLTPLLGSGTDTSSAPGFQPDPAAELVATAAGAQTGAAGRIQEAVDRAPSGGTVRVAAGEYAESVAVAKPLSLLGANAGISPNDADTPLTPNAARGAESTLSVAGDTARAISIQAADVTVDGFRFTNTGATQAGVQNPLIGAGVNFGGAAPDAAVVNNVFDAITRTAVYFNGPAMVVGGTVDDNRVTGATRPSGCGAGAVANSNCGRQLFNLWMTDELSFSRNVVTAAPGNGDRTRVLNVTLTGATSTDVAINDNTIRNACTYTCFTIAGGARNVMIDGNDVGLDVGNAVQLHSTWTGGTVWVTDNVFSTPNDFALVIDVPTAGPPASLGDVVVTRNAFEGKAIRNAAPQPVAATCNWWGAASGPAAAQIQGQATTSPFLGGAALDGPCPAPPPAPVDSDGDGMADFADCAPLDASAPSKIGTDANCDGVPDEIQQPQQPAPQPGGEQQSAPSGNPAPPSGKQLTTSAEQALRDTPVTRDEDFDLPGAQVFVPTAEPSRRVPVVSGDDVTIDRQAANRGTTQTLMAIAAPDSDTRATVRQTAKIGDRTIELPVQRLTIEAGSSEPVKLPLTKGMRKALKNGQDIELTLAITVIDANGNRSTQTKTYTVKAEAPKKKPKK